jgi:hypothetical protein
VSSAALVAGLLGVSLGACKDTQDTSSSTQDTSGSTQNKAGEARPAAGAASGADAPPAPKGLEVKAVRLFGVGGRRPDGIFARGETVLLRCLLRGLESRDRRIHLRAAITVRAVDGSLLLRRPEFTAVKQRVPPGKSTELVEAAVRLTLSPASPPGRYAMEVRLRDALGSRTGSLKTDLTISGPGEPRTEKLAIRYLRAPQDEDLRAGLPLYIDFEVANPTLQPVARASVDPAPARRGATARPSMEGAQARPSMEGAQARPSMEGAQARPSMEGAQARPSTERAAASSPRRRVTARPRESSPGARPESQAQPETPAQPRFRVEVKGQAVIVDGAGVVRHTSDKTLFSGTLPFRTRQLPIRWGIPLPADLPQGEYLLRLAISDPASGHTARTQHRFELLPAGLGIYAVRLSGASQVPRQTFMRGERVNVDLMVAGWAAPAKVDLGVGLVGPDHGFYLVRKKAHRIRGEAGGSGNRKLRIPLIIPEFAPRGRWTLKLRAVDHTAGSQASRTLSFQITGRRISPLPTLRVQGLNIRQQPGGPPLPGLFLRAGKTYHLDFAVGGMRLLAEQGYYHRVSLVCTLRLRDKQGRLVAEKKKACAVNRRFSFQPRRLRLRASWTLPPRVLGLHQLEVEVLDRQSDRVSMLQRRVFILAGSGAGATPTGSR